MRTNPRRGSNSKWYGCQSWADEATGAHTCHRVAHGSEQGDALRFHGVGPILFIVMLCAVWNCGSECDSDGRSPDNFTPESTARDAGGMQDVLEFPTIFNTFYKLLEFGYLRAPRTPASRGGRQH